MEMPLVVELRLTIVERLVKRNSNERPWVQTKRRVYQESPGKPGETVPHEISGQCQQDLIRKGLGVFLPEILVHPLSED